MKIKLLNIVEGVNQFPLRYICFTTDPIYNIEFDGPKNINWTLQKYGSRGSGNLIECKDSTKLPKWNFTLGRDMMSHVEIHSDCSGLLTIHFKKDDHTNDTFNDPAKKALEKFQENARENYYKQYYQKKANYVKPTNLRDLVYHRSEKPFMDLCQKYRTNVVLENIKTFVCQRYEFIKGFYITSSIDQTMEIFTTGVTCFLWKTIDIIEGKHYYPINIILTSTPYSKIDIFFKENVECVEYDNLVLSKTLLNIFGAHNIYDKENGYVVVSGLMYPIEEARKSNLKDTIEEMESCN